MDYSVKLRNQSASRRGSPIYSASPFTPCRRPYSGGSHECTQRCLPREQRPSPSLHWLGNHRSSRSRTSEGCVTKLQRSLYATARWCGSAPPCPGFFKPTFLGPVAPLSPPCFVSKAPVFLSFPRFSLLDLTPSTP